MDSVNESKISQLIIYPVKSLQGIQLQQAELTKQGLKWDRHWMIVDETGRFVTQRNIANMAKITSEITETELVLTSHEQTPLRIKLAELPNVKRLVSVWGAECEALDEGEVASKWLTQVLGPWRESKLYLVRMNPNFHRQVDPKYTQGLESHTFFADGFPVLVTNTASLAALNNKLTAGGEQSVDMSRFRTNVEVESEQAFAEHNHAVLQLIGTNTQLLLCKPCQRCKVTSIDQTTAEIASAKQPLATLSEMNHVAKKGAYFGHNAIVQLDTSASQPTVIKVGDRVQWRKRI